MSDHIDKLNNKLRTHTRIILNTFVIGLRITAVIMFIIMILGVYKIVEGTIVEFNFIHFASENENYGIIHILQGLELIFLSPLFYLLMLSLTKYISATRPEISDDPLEVKRTYMNHAIMEIMNVKILNVGLFISIFTLHSLGLVLQNKMSTPLIFYIISLMAILIGYYFILDMLVEKLRKNG